MMAMEAGFQLRQRILRCDRTEYENVWFHGFCSETDQGAMYAVFTVV